eukprot:RCo005653
MRPSLFLNGTSAYGSCSLPGLNEGLQLCQLHLAVWFKSHTKKSCTLLSLTEHAPEDLYPATLAVLLNSSYSMSTSKSAVEPAVGSVCVHFANGVEPPIAYEVPLELCDGRWHHLRVLSPSPAMTGLQVIVDGHPA